MKSQLFLIRHGETDWNRLEKLQGHSDIVLNDQGRAQASSLMPFAESLKVDVVISSDLKRAVETARLAFPNAKELISDARLREVHLGKAEGQNRHDLEKLFGPDILRAWFSTAPEDMKQRFPEGESRAEALIRMRESIFFHAKSQGPRRIAFVTHGLVMRTLTQSLVGEYRPEFRAPNCATFEFEMDHAQDLLRWIQIHLPK